MRRRLVIKKRLLKRRRLSMIRLATRAEEFVEVSFMPLTFLQSALF